MKTLTQKLNIALISTVLATSVLSISQASAQERGARGGEGRGNPFTRMDTDGDGFLSLDEMTANIVTKAEKMLARKDTDEDGVISLEEYMANRQGAAIDLSDIAGEIVQCVEDVKAETGDENIIVPDADHFKSPEDRFADVDTSGDGLIDVTEIEAHLMTKTTNAFDTMDTDEDGLVSQDEFKTQHGSRRATRGVIRGCVAELTAEEV